MTAPTVRAFLGDASVFSTAKAAASYVGMNRSTWSSGTVVQPSRAITKEGRLGLDRHRQPAAVPAVAVGAAGALDGVTRSPSRPTNRSQRSQ